MMKKVVSVLLALFLMLGGLCASAETAVSAEKAVTPLFEVSRIDPEGYVPSEVTSESVLLRHSNDPRGGRKALHGDCHLL